MEHYDKWKLQATPWKERIYTHCAECGYEIYRGDTYMDCNGDPVHIGCLDDYVKRILNISEKTAGGEEE